MRGFIKSDSVPLFILQEQNKQILQINMTKCINENHAADIMRSMAMQYASGEIERSMLKEKRDEVLNTQKAWGGSDQTRKAPKKVRTSSHESL